MKYSDPSGYTWLSHFTGWVGDNWKPIVTTIAAITVAVVVGVCTAGLGDVVLVGALSGMAGGFTGGVLGTGLNGGNLGQCLTAGFTGAVQGGIFGAFGGVAASFAPAGALWGSLYGAGSGSLLGGASSVMNGSSFWQGAAMGAIFGGIGGGIGGYMSAKAQGLNRWTGAQIPRPNIELAPLQSIPYNSAGIPDQLSHYTPDDPGGWTTIGQAEGDPIWFTPNSELSSSDALSQLSLKQAPNWRIDINTTNPSFDPSRVMYIQKVGPLYGQPGGGIEVVYKGPLDIRNITVNITRLP